MQTHNIKRKVANKKSVSVGRGGTRGKTSGRGTKGQNARAGHKKRPEMRDFIKRLPKLRGRGKNSNTGITRDAFAVNVGRLDAAFKDGDTVSPSTLRKAGILTAQGGMPVKILGEGELAKKLTLEGCRVSAGAKAKIEKAGGSVK